MIQTEVWAGEASFPSTPPAFVPAGFPVTLALLSGLRPSFVKHIRSSETRNRSRVVFTVFFSFCLAANATSRRIRETEAEAAAFVVCQGVGLETGSAASDYIQVWNGDARLLMESLAYVRQAASQMLAALTDE
jgi:hypothetical protein